MTDYDVLFIVRDISVRCHLLIPNMVTLIHMQSNKINKVF